MADSLLLLLLLLLAAEAQAGPIPSPGERQDNVDMQQVLGQFLHMLNLTEQGPRSRARNEAPEYMMELYKKFSSDRSAAPAANIIRSFRNQEHSSGSVLSSGVRTQRLQFNISIPQQEMVVSAELRIHMFLHRKSHTADAWTVRIFDTQRSDTRYREPLASKHIHRKDISWEVFDMTNAIRNWRKVGIETPNLEVCIQKAFRNTNDWRYVGLDIDRDPDGKHEPVMIVFSNDQTEDQIGDGNKDQKETQMHSNIIHEDGGEDPQMISDERQWTDGNKDQKETQMQSNIIYEDGARVRRSAKVEDCRIAEMYVDFKDIGWDSFILAPSGYQAFTCRGVCSYPLTQKVTPTKHAIVQTLLNLKSPQRAAQTCCVPTELKPISLLYENENGVVVLDNKYGGMVVKECGCR
ncbi:bone morphogenetic protein 10-like [Danio rerio]|uniref:Bone morphogenetic protein 10-like n=1 Tax=Danio rerio TaxID=7955 RepID=A0AC58GL19_DANRE